MGYDPRQGCLFLNNRYHDPQLGTFISVDPLVQSTGEAYIYASGNPTTLSDPTGRAPCAVQSCPDGVPVVHYGRHDLRSWVWPLVKFVEPDPTDGGTGDALDETGSRAVPYSYAKQVFDRHTPLSGPAGRLTSDDLLLLRQMPLDHPDDGRDCDWKCLVATLTTGIVGYSTAGAVCAGVTVETFGGAAPWACGGSFLTASGAVNVVYESTSNPAADGGDLACTFVFGTSSPGVNVIVSVAGSGATAAGNGATRAAEYASEIAQGLGYDAAVNIAGGAVCD